MKTSRLFLLLASLAGPAALLFSGCSKWDDTPSTTTKVSDAVSDSWTSIKDYTYDKRVEFSASIDRMSAKMDDGTKAVKAKFAGVPDTASRDRESAEKDYDAARADLKARLVDLSNASADTWADAKAKVAQAWQHVQAAYDKLTG